MRTVLKSISVNGHNHWAVIAGFKRSIELLMALAATNKNNSFLRSAIW